MGAMDERRLRTGPSRSDSPRESRPNQMTPQHPDSRTGERFWISRRRAVAVLAAGAAAIAGFVPLARRLTSGLRETRHRSAPPDPTPVDPSLLQRVATLTGALFGHRLDERDTRDLVSDLTLLVRRDGGWRAEFAEAADYVDRLARGAGAPSFADASDDVRETIVDAIMRPSITSKRSSAQAVVSRNERVRRRIRTNLVTRLAIAYSASAPAWRRRGYARIPGQSGDPREYTRAGMDPAC